MCLADEVEGSRAAVDCGSSSVMRLVSMLLLSPLHLGPFLHIFSPEESAFVYHLPRHDDYSHV